MEINLLKLELDYVFPFSLKPSTPFGKRKGERDRNIIMQKSQEEKRNRKRKRGIKSSIADSYFEYGDDYDPILRSECYFSTCAQANRLATVKMQ